MEAPRGVEIEPGMDCPRLDRRVCVTPNFDIEANKRTVLEGTEHQQSGPRRFMQAPSFQKKRGNLVPLA